MTRFRAATDNSETVGATTPIGAGSTPQLNLDSLGDPARCALVLFAGRPRPASLPAALEHAGWHVDAVDTVLGGDLHDLLRAEVQEVILRAGEQRRYQLIWLGTPCASFSVLWTQPSRPVLRDRLHPAGRPGLSPAWQLYVAQQNALASFSAAVALQAWEAGATFVIENPVDRGLRQSPHFRWAWRAHAPLWLLPSVRALAQAVRPRWVTFAQCAWGSEFQKWTTLMVGGQRSRHLDVLNDMPCCHPHHARVARGYERRWREQCGTRRRVSRSPVRRRRGGVLSGRSDPHHYLCIQM